MNRLAWYYDWTPDQHIAGDMDGEGNLCWLCPDCARDLGEQVALAGSEDVSIGRACDVCGCAEAFDALTHWPPIL